MSKALLHPLTGQPVLPLGFRKDGRAIWPVMGGDDTVPPAGDTITVPVTPEQPATPAGRTFTEAELNAERERVRKEEKDKLYRKLEEQEQKAKEFESFKEQFEKEAKRAADEAAAKARQEAEEAARKKWEETDAKNLIADVQQQWEQKFADLQQEREQERALFQREQEFSQLQNYIQRRVSEETSAGTIAPELVDLVSGNNAEEIEASIATLKAKTDAILASVQQAQVAARAQMRGVSTAGYAATGPMDTNPGTKTYSAAELAAMPMSEYAKHRQSLIGAASAQQNRGMFG